VLEQLAELLLRPRLALLVANACRLVLLDLAAR
jgi:hypothetical protein